MCDTLVVVPPREAQGSAVWFAKNSDREPGEAQVTEHHPRARHARGARVRVTYIEIPEVSETHEVVLSRPAWMWGAEMGANEHGLAIGNEAVFTRLPVAKTGLTGMDLVRLALSRCKTADEALDLVTWMIERHGQGGPAGYRDKRFSYHNAFMFADPDGAWLLETADRCWVAERVSGARSTSNVLSIGERYDRIGKTTVEDAQRLGFLRRREPFDFRRCFADRAMGYLSGGDVRRAGTLHALGALGGRAAGALTLADVARVVRDHAGLSPHEGARLLMPCAHASYLPTRGAGQTTGTLVSLLSRGGSRHLFTGTSSPCLGVLKPVPLGGDLVDTGPAPRPSGADGESLFWRHERLHRRVLRDYEARSAALEPRRAALEERSLEASTARAASEAWAEHREAALEWADDAARTRPTRRAWLFDAYWRVQSLRDGLPG
jgi:secernin